MYIIYYNIYIVLFKFFTMLLVCAYKNKLANNIIVMVCEMYGIEIFCMKLYILIFTPYNTLFRL